MKRLKKATIWQFIGSSVVLFLLIVTPFSNSAKAQAIPLGEAVDNTSLNWTTGGDAEWFGQSATSYYGGDAAQSGEVGPGQSSWIETTVTGPGVLSFYWRDTDFCSHSLGFSIDGDIKFTIGCTFPDEWEQKIFYISPGSHTVRWTFAQNDSDGDGFLDKVALTEPVGISEAVDLHNLTWVTSGDAEWFGQSVDAYYGGDAAQSGNIGNGQTSWIETTVNGPGVLWFYWKASFSTWVPNYGFYVDGVLQSEWVIDDMWRLQSYSLPPGSHTLRWVFKPNDSGHAGLLDKVVFTNETVSLEEALDDPSLHWTTGGEANWFGQATESSSDGDAAQSGTVNSGQSSWIQIIVAGPGALSFDCKKSAQFDRLVFSIDGNEKAICNSPQEWERLIEAVPSGHHTLRWVFETDRRGNVGLLDRVGYFPLTLSEAVDNDTLNWTTGGDADWFGQPWESYDGRDAAQSGKIGGGQTSWIETTVTGPGILSFYWKVSSSFAWTDLVFYMDGVAKATCWADQAWELQAYSIPSGTHTLRWNFAPFLSGYAGFLDKVVFTPGPVLLLKSPNGEENWYHREVYAIRWLSTEDVGSSVKLELYKGGSVSKTISSSTDNDGYYGWSVPVTLEPGTDYQIKITSISNPSIHDYSDSHFSIKEWFQSSFVGLLALWDWADDYAETRDDSELDVGDEAGESFTIEAWVDIERNSAYSYDRLYIVNKSDSYSLYTVRYYDPADRVVHACIGSGLTLSSGQSHDYLTCKWLGPGVPAYWFGWHHIALVFYQEAGEAQTFLDGEAFSDSWSVGPVINNSAKSMRVGEKLHWAVDEVRISDVARYTGSVTYTLPTSPFTCDEHTRALWHFDEFDGATVFHDTCGAVDNLLVGYNGAHTEGVPGVSLTAVTISGPTNGVTNTAYTFSATASPVTATTPITYTWAPMPDSGQNTSVVVYTWPITGTKTITATATNAGSTVMNTHTITISEEVGWQKVYLPIILCNP